MFPTVASHSTVLLLAWDEALVHVARTEDGATGGVMDAIARWIAIGV